MMDYESAALFEHRFWLQVLGDHSRFICSNLAPVEKKEIARAEAFIKVFDQLLEQLKNNMDRMETIALSRYARLQTLELRVFKLHLLKRHLAGKIDFHLPPTFVNHMVNELDEYVRILSRLAEGELPPVFNPVHHHILWLSDAAGHAESIRSSLDMSEKELMDRSDRFAKQFTEFYLKAVEMAGFLRTRISEFPALRRFHHEAELEIQLFSQFLRELEELSLTKEALGTLMPLMPDHMAREECYYITKLSQVSDVKEPDCDPGKPRTE